MVDWVLWRLLLLSVLFIDMHSCFQLPAKLIRFNSCRYKTTKAAATQVADQLSHFPSVIVTKGKTRLFLDGNPIVYGGAVEKVIGSPSIGDEVLVKDHMMNVVGRGVFNDISSYRVRLLARSSEPKFQSPLSEIIAQRLLAAKSLRESIGLPKAESDTVYRLVNGEGDRLSGLVIDVLRNTLVIQSSAYWIEHHKSSIMTAIEQVYPPQQYKYVWRQSVSRLKQDGYEISTEESPEVASSDPADVEKEIVYENGFKYVVYPTLGQKTGFFCDQRENRRMIGNISNGKTVLDLYCYSGGFAMHAAKGGATSIRCVDSSQYALDLVQQNLAINDISVGNIELVKQDAVDYMRSLVNDPSQPKFDIVICDPPKLAPSRKNLANARSKYVQINTLAMQLVKPGGLLLTCTCSAAVTQAPNEFAGYVQEAGRLSKRDVTILSTSHAAPDHTIHISFPESNYLTAMLVRVL